VLLSRSKDKKKIKTQKYKYLKLDMLAHAYNHSTQKAMVGGSRETLSPTKPKMYSYPKSLP
jgi:hypothetical protein